VGAVVVGVVHRRLAVQETVGYSPGGALVTMSLARPPYMSQTIEDSATVTIESE